MYKFYRNKHLHTLDEKPLMGVTTVLSVISKPSLIPWAAKMTADYVTQEVAKVTYTNVNDLIDDLQKRILPEAQSAHRKKKEKAGDWGTIVHKKIEEFVKRAITENKGEIGKIWKCIPDHIGPDQAHSINLFLDWARNNKVKFIESEKNVYSRELWIGGILDLVFEMNGQRYIGDVKTSSGIYNEAFFQMGAYELCLEEMGVDKVDEYLVINLKKTGEMDLKTSSNREINKEAFKSALSLWKIINSLK